MLNPKCKLSRRPVFTFILPGGIHPSAPVSYATVYDVLHLHTVSWPYSTATR